jgi:hypothetical protein
MERKGSAFWEGRKVLCSRFSALVAHNATVFNGFEASSFDFPTPYYGASTKRFMKLKQL